MKCEYCEDSKWVHDSFIREEGEIVGEGFKECPYCQEGE
jgi:uncharacterized Zn-finger protein